MRLSDFVAKRLQFLGIEHSFMVTGGAAMHLNDSISKVFKERLFFLHHEQSCSMAADAYARIKGKPCLVNVTAGPGAINALNGVFELMLILFLFILSGQSKRETLVVNSGVSSLRQLGDQEADVVALATPVCKAVHLLQEPLEVHKLINEFFITATTGRPGPVWIDIPIDVQSFELPEEFQSFINEPLNSSYQSLTQSDISPQNQIDELASIFLHMTVLFYMLKGIRVSHAYQEFLDFLDQWPIACVTGWNSNDLLWDTHPCYCGRPGTVGNRTGNLQFNTLKLC